MKRDSWHMNIRYILAMSLYLCTYSSIVVFASSYLLEKGFSNSVIGLSFSAVSALVLVTQPAIASMADKDQGHRIYRIIQVFLGSSAAAAVGLLTFAKESVFLLPLFMLVEYCLLTVQPLLNSLAFLYESQGIHVYFGLARGIGSAVYGVSSFLVGGMIKHTGGTGGVPYVYLFANLLLILVLSHYGRRMARGKTAMQRVNELPLTMREFLKKQRRFTLFAIGGIFVYFAHVIIFNFFIHIVARVGGSESDVGNAVFLSTLLEAFATAAMPWLVKKFGCRPLLRFSVGMFIVRNIIMYMAPNMGWIYVGSAFQLVSYALFYPGSILYAAFVIPETDQVKGQSLIAINYTASSIFANLIGGVAIDRWGIRQALMVGIILSCIGAVIVFVSLKEPVQKH